MASPPAPKCEKHHSSLIEIDEVISSIKDSYFDKPVIVDEHFLNKLKSVLKAKVTTTDHEVSLIQPMQFEDEGLLMPNEIMMKIFEYLGLKDVSRCAQVSKQFYSISQETWKSWKKITIKKRKVPSEFIIQALEKGVECLHLFDCEILPLRAEFSYPFNLHLNLSLNLNLKLKTLGIDGCYGDNIIFPTLLKILPMEKIEIKNCYNMFSREKISQIIENLPLIGSRLKCLNLDYNNPTESEIKLIVDSCVNLEELDFHNINIDTSCIKYVSENLTPKILKLDLFLCRSFDDSALCSLVKRCPKLQTLDIRDTNTTWYGICAIIDNLHFLEELALPIQIMEDLGFPDNIDLGKMKKLRSMKQIKKLHIGFGLLDPFGSLIFEKDLPRLIPIDFGETIAKVSGSNFREMVDLPSMKLCKLCKALCTI